MKTQKLLILQGPIASGKSTWARNFIKGESKEWMVVNRDSIRDMLGDYWVPSREDLVTQIEFLSISSGIASGYNVIVDATNLNPKTLKKFQDLVTYFGYDAINKINVEIETKEFRTPLRTCLYRDWKRGLFGGRRVGKEVIKNFYKKYYGTS